MPERNTTTFQDSLVGWSEAAVPVLQEVARTYGNHITYKDLATRVFDITGVRTDMLVNNLSSMLLGKVIRICREQSLPSLTSLVVTAADGTVGPGFDEALRAAGKDIPESPLERERAAAAERLECYRVYCPDVPADAVPQLTPKYEARVNPVKKEAPRLRPVCSVHGIQLPATGICDDCA
ncbi:hypothetical protein [Paenarthrobacter sp. YJN-5]|uniref:hypothetical protein n=1 Tax=Paenarthrobacter sp. YJN-5 TaxID=2735316 RepID=UPI001877BE75|nr:hypothetical protein [Paenarthrobacter sp. YJN-5]QOT19274.1 hypothetical protein HMI59_21460 [Paenarthrobacter sp. YJN-5]